MKQVFNHINSTLFRAVQILLSVHLDRYFLCRKKKRYFSLETHENHGLSGEIKFSRGDSNIYLSYEGKARLFSPDLQVSSSQLWLYGFLCPYFCDTDKLKWIKIVHNYQ